MVVNPIKYFTKFFRLTRTQLTDSESGGSEAERKRLHQKIAIRKTRRVPVGNYILLLAEIALTLIVLEYFI